LKVVPLKAAWRQEPRERERGHCSGAALGYRLDALSGGI
jgi:hypothetical protein